MPGVHTDPCPEDALTLALSRPLATFLTVISHSAAVLYPLVVALEAGYLTWLLLKLFPSCPFVSHLPVPRLPTTILTPTATPPCSFLDLGA